MMLQLNPPLPLNTPKGPALAHFVLDYGPINDYNTRIVNFGGVMIPQSNPNFTVLGDAGELTISGIRRNFIRCLCHKCGTEFTVRKDHVFRKRNPIKSCGCNQFPITGRIAHNAKPEGMAAARNVYNSYKNKCKMKNITFDITFDDFLKITKKNCFYCDAAPSQSYLGVYKSGVRAGKRKVNGNFVYNGIDRITPSNGYTLDNIRPCCRYCNSAKLDRTEEQFYKWIENLSKNLGILPQ